jgi:hypothetical protein
VAEPLTYDEFTALADRLQVDADIRDELFPMVRDLLGLAAMLDRLTPELHAEIPPESLSVGVSGGLR